MSAVAPPAQAIAADTAWAAALLALDPFALGGVCLRCLPGPLRDRWLDDFASLLPARAPWRKVPLNVSDQRLLGGLDLTATLRAGRPVAERGLLAEADGGVVVLAMAERISSAAAARVCAMLDCSEIALERDGFTRRLPARAGVLALDEGLEADEHPPAGLLERLALHLDLSAMPPSLQWSLPCDAREIAAARERLQHVRVSDEMVEAIRAAGMALGVASLRASGLALGAARAAAALAARDAVCEEDLSLAARLVLAPRATRLPASEASSQEETAEPEPDENSPGEHQAQAAGGAEEERDGNPASVTDQVLDAAQAAIPPALLSRLQSAAAAGKGGFARGRAGALRQSPRRGRPAGVRAAPLRPGARLNVVDTLRAAAPWQPVRRRELDCAAGDGRRRVLVRPADFRVTRFKDRCETTTIFAVDASGSAAMHRLAEAKGAVELLLAECYVRRDRVALVAFRGDDADVLLPPTRSLVRAKRSLARLPGGGGTPLARGIDVATQLADGVRQRGDTATVVLLTDGRANVARDGSPGRSRAAEDALRAGRALRAAGVRSVVLDTSPRPSERAREVAQAMGAVYQPLPFAEAAAISRAARAAAMPDRGR